MLAFPLQAHICMKLGLVLLFAWNQIKTWLHLYFWDPADSQFEGASFDVLVVQTESQWEITLLRHNVHKLISPILVVHYFPVHYAAIWGEHLDQQT